MQLAEFVRAFELRGPELMWLLGAGASASAGVPTAQQMIWQFRQAIYCSEQQVPRQLVENVADPAVETLLLQHFSRDPRLPAPNDPDEYSALFELAYPDEADRRRYIEQAVLKGEPSFGHLALGTLIALDKVRLIWTTNFDALVEDAATAALGKASRLTVAQLETAQTVLDCLNQNRWPLVAKLHGDFRSVRLKNTAQELQDQDARMRAAMRNAALRFGLIVVGYSGRDDSVMQSLEDAAAEGGFPNGLFWVHRESSNPPHAVRRLIDAVRACGNQAEIIQVETFDELMDALLTVQELPPEHAARVDSVRPSRRRAPAPLHDRSGGWPLIRLNALPLIDHPTSCRRIRCEIGGTKEVREALTPHNDVAIGVRRRDGVIAFGSDAALKEALSPYRIDAFDLAPLSLVEGRDSMDASLLYEALLRALCRERPLSVASWRRRLLMIDPARLGDSAEILGRAVNGLHGTIPGTSLRWAEAVEFRLEARLGRVWMVYEPTVWTEKTDQASVREATREWSRERQAARYNGAWSEILRGWEELIAGRSQREFFTISTYGTTQGINASFTVGATAGYSWRRRS